MQVCLYPQGGGLVRIFRIGVFGEDSTEKKLRKKRGRDASVSRVGREERGAEKGE